MKYLFVILVGVGIILHSFSKVIILINFQLNKEYISKNLCQQKSIKNNSCKGHCHLKKQLQKDEKRDQHPNSLKDTKEFQIFCQNKSSFQFNSFKFPRTDFPTFEILITQPPSFSVFHPPKA